MSNNSEIEKAKGTSAPKTPELDARIDSQNKSTAENLSSNITPDDTLEITKNENVELNSDASSDSVATQNLEKVIDNNIEQTNGEQVETSIDLSVSESTDNVLETTSNNAKNDTQDKESIANTQAPDGDKFVMPEIPEIDSDTGEILNAEKTDNPENNSANNLNEEKVEEVEKTKKELRKEKRHAALLAFKGKINNIFQAICKHFARLKQKKYWIPLVVGHAIMFSCMGFYAYKEIQYAKSTDFVVDSIEQAFTAKDLPSLLAILNYSVTRDRFKKGIKKAIENNPDFAKYIGQLADDNTLDSTFEKMLVNIVNGIDEDPLFNKEYHFFPKNLATQIRKDPFVLNQELSKPQNSIYIFEIMLDTVRFGKYPLQIKARYFKDKWSIVEISNLGNIIALFDKEIKRIRVKKDNFEADEQAFANALILQNLPNLQCSANLTTLSGQDVLIIQVTTDKNTAQNNLISWSVETKVYVDDNIVHEEYVKANGIFQAGTEFLHSSNIRLSLEQSVSLKGHVLRCDAQPKVINLPDGVFYTYKD